MATTRLIAMLAHCSERELCKDDYHKAACELAQAAARLADTFLVKDSVPLEIAYAGLRGAQIKCAVARGIYMEHVAEHGCEQEKKSMAAGSALARAS